ncbi:MAG: cytochrome c biogenesis protein ResB, partial [Desulfobulbus sp.]|nr:cytochrome c biogenesis protein ResB [Desulfobulbus sp.]
VFRILRRDSLTISPERLRHLPIKTEVKLPASPEAANDQILRFLKKKGWQPRSKSIGTSWIAAADRGGWTRFGVYIVHGSILLILVGALIGSSAVARHLLRDPQFAFKGSILLPEGESTDHVTTFKTGEPVDLGFQLRCDSFTIEHYPNGMPKTYRTRASIIENEQKTLTADIEVNKPLTYKGITFYQSNYQPYQNYRVILQKKESNMATTALIVPATQLDWHEAGVSYGIINRESQGEVTRRLKIWFSDNQDEPAVFWIDNDRETVIQRSSGTYLLTISQRYATGLQATKDPGVWLVYSGCLLMLVGLYLAFFLSHKKIYAFIQEDDQGSRILFAGETNKNKVGFEKKFSELVEEFNK